MRVSAVIDVSLNTRLICEEKLPALATNIKVILAPNVFVCNRLMERHELTAVGASH